MIIHFYLTYCWTKFTWFFLWFTTNEKKNNEVLNKVNPYDSHVYGSTVFSPPDEHTHTTHSYDLLSIHIIYLFCQTNLIISSFPPIFIV